MSWGRVDDSFHSHPKVLRCSLAARGLWVTGLAYACDYLTDGFVPNSFVKSLGKGGAAAATELVDVWLWHPDERDGEKGWRFHDWHDYHPAAAEILEKRRRDAQRKRNPKPPPTEEPPSEEDFPPDDS